MIPLKRRTLLGLMGSSLVTACATPAIVTRSDDPFEGGIGGTGIVGVLTDFSSLIVNGLRVEVTGATSIRSHFGAVSDSALRRGQELTIFATRSRDRLVARQVQIGFPLIGPARLGPGGALTVNGAPVLREPGSLGSVTFGERVTVSGVWSREGVVASRIDPADQPADLIAGVAGRGGVTGVTVGGVPVRGARGRIAPTEGAYVTLTGRHDGESFVATRVREGRFRGNVETMRQLSVEGFLEPQAAAPGFRLAGLGHSFARELRLQPLAARRAVYFGGYDGDFRARAGYVVPEDFAARQALLRDGYSAFGGEVVETL